MAIQYRARAESFFFVGQFTKITLDECFHLHYIVHNQGSAYMSINEPVFLVEKCVCFYGFVKPYESTNLMRFDLKIENSSSFVVFNVQLPQISLNVLIICIFNAQISVFFLLTRTPNTLPERRYKKNSLRKHYLN